MPAKIRDGKVTRATILDAARSQFSAHGFERTTIRSIASAAGVDPALVMHYFGSKADLFAAVS
ncbi:MAG: helix-turn-helix domain-containing protein, partial [Mycobacterium sp.]